MPTRTTSAREQNWLFETLTEDRQFEQRRFFGMDAAYLDGRLFFAVANRTKEPWSGLMVGTDRTHHAELRREFPPLVPHPVLRKWMYLTQSHPDFEVVANRLVSLARARDPRLGIHPQLPRRRPLPDLPAWDPKEKPRRRRPRAKR